PTARFCGSQAGTTASSTPSRPEPGASWPGSPWGRGRTASASGHSPAGTRWGIPAFSGSRPTFHRPLIGARNDSAGQMKGGREMKKIAAVLAAAAVAATIVVWAPWASSAKSGTAAPYEPVLDPADFSTTIDNPYFPLPVGRTLVYQGTKDG